MIPSLDPVVRTPQFSRFSPVLESPEVILSQALEGNFWPIIDAGGSPLRWTLNERQTISDRIAASNPNNVLLKTMANVATNPLVWLAVASEAVFRIPAGRVFKLSASLSPIYKEYKGPLNVFGLRHLLTGRQKFDGTSFGSIFQSMDDSRRNLISKWSNTIKPHLDEAGALHKFSFLEENREADVLIAAWLSGLHKTRVETFLVKTDKLAGGFAVQERSLPAILDSAKLERAIDERGLRPLAQSMRRLYNEVFDDVLGTSDKKIALVRALKEGGLPDGGLAPKLVAGALGDDVLEAFREGFIKEDDLIGLIEKAIPKQQFYFPRNVTSVYHRDGGVARQLDPVAQAKATENNTIPRILRVSGSSVARTGALPIWDPADMRLLRDMGLQGGDVQTFDSILALGEEALQGVATSGRPTRLVRLSADNSLHKYINDMSRTYATYVQPINSAILAEQKLTFDAVQKRLDEFPDDATNLGIFKTRDGKSIPAWSILEDSAPDAGGTWTVWDALRREVNLVKPNGVGAGDQFIHDSVVRTYLPLATGQQKIRTGILTQGYINSQAWTRNVLDGGFGRFLDGAGLKGIHDYMNKWSTTPIPARAIDQGIVRYLYASTLGINLASASINLTQPFATTIRYTGPAALAQGYVEAFKDVSTYAKARLATNVFAGFETGPSAALARQALMRKHIRYADDAGITELDHVFEKLIAEPSLRSKAGLLSRGEELLLKAFTSSELMNRSVSAHAAAARASKTGLSTAVDAAGRIIDPNAARFVRRVVEESQFAPNLLNSPTAFIDPNNILSEPLLRQFLTFPIRTATGVILGGRLGGREGPFNFFSPDLMKVVGYSALIYEVGKSFNADLYDVTPIGAATGGLARTTGAFAPLPAPPILTIPVEGLMGIFGEEKNALAFVLPALIPGGVATSKALGILPGPSAIDGRLRRQYADYNKRTPDGRIPIYDNEGRLLEFRSPLQLGLQAAGFDRFGQFKDESELIGQMIRDRDKLFNYRRHYLDELFRGNVGKAAAVQKEHRRRFGFDLQVTERQIQAYLRAKGATRIERSLDTLPKEIRGTYREIAARTLGPRLGLSPEQFIQNEQNREKFSGQTPSLSPEARRHLEQTIRQQQEQRFERPVSKDSFGGFGNF